MRRRVRALRPALFLVGQHGRDAFVLLNQYVDVDAHAWHALDPDSFDRTKLAAAPPLATPVMVTLVGEMGAKVVSTSTQTLIKEGLSGTRREPTVALRIPTNERFTVAVFGSHEDYTWKQANGFDDMATREAWAHSLGHSPNNAWMRRAGDIEFFMVRDAKTNAVQTTILYRGVPSWVTAGEAIGVLTTNRVRYAVFAQGNALTTATIDTATAKPRA